MTDIQFAVVDLETTGLFAGASDRVVEIAVIRMTPEGRPLDHYETLVNPDRDVGPSHLHGITAREVKEAPRFADVAGDVLSRLAGAVLVAHNIDFDYRFLDAEFTSLGVDIPDCTRLCTMRLGPLVAGAAASRKLADVCRALSIEAGITHTAATDAALAAQVLTKVLQRISVKSFADLAALQPSGTWIPVEQWPSRPRTGKTLTRKASKAIHAKRPSYIASLIDRLPATLHDDAAINSYLALLDRILEDRRVTVEEQATLEALCRETRLSRDQATKANREYLRDLIRVALADGIITEPEKVDLDDVARLLGIPTTDYEQVLVDVRHSLAPAPAKGADLQGKSVCFTGELVSRINGERVTREQAWGLATQHGMVVRKAVTKDLDILVAVDADSISGKAKKAHKYGIRVIAEPVFFQMLGIQVE